MSHTYLLKRGQWFYFNKRIRTKILRVALRTNRLSIARERLAHVYLVTKQSEKLGMNYLEIKQNAIKEAQRLHDEWVYEHFSGSPLSDDQLLGEEVSRDRIRERLQRGDLPLDELKESLAFMMYVEMRNQTWSQWRDPSLFADTALPVSYESVTSAQLSTYLEEYFEELKAGKENISSDTLAKYRTAITDFIEVVGDRSSSEITFSDGKAFRSALLKTPSHRNSIPEYKNKSIQQLVALNLPREKCLATDTISHRLKHVRRFFNWLKDMKHVAENPLENVSIESNSQPRPAFSEKDLSRIFTSPVFDLGHAKNKSVATQSRWWLLVLAAYTGARIGELCQLRLKDVEERDGLLCVSINDDDFKKLKTGAAKRLIPIHPVLIRLGITEYIDRLKANGEDRLLPTIPDATMTKKAGAAASDWFGQKYRPEYLRGFKEQGKVFHSFRHTFIQAAINADVELVKLQQMVGHESKEMGATMTYRGEGYSANQLMDQLNKVVLKGVDVGWLEDNHWSLIKKP